MGRSRFLAEGEPGRVCVVGVGAMGSLLAAGLLEGGADVTLVDRGARLEQLRAHGLTLRRADGEERTYRDFRTGTVPPPPEGAYDVVVLAVKAYDLPDAASAVAPVLGPHTVVVTLQNGIPWWYFHRYEGPLAGHRLASVDPDGRIEAAIDPARIVGCVPYPAAEVLPDGAVRHVEGTKLPLGELDGSISRRLERMASLLESAGFRCRLLEDVRSETWLKAWGNLSFNPLSALTGATLEQICRFPPTRRLAADMMREAQAVGEALGASFRVGIERRIEGAEAVGAHRTSMAQDLHAGRPLETEALVGAVIEIADTLDLPVPSIRAVYAAVRLLDRTRGSAGAVMEGTVTDTPGNTGMETQNAGGDR